MLEKLRELKEESKEQNPRLFKTSIFLLKLLIAGIIFRAIIWLNPDTQFFQQTLATVIQSLLNLLGFSFEQRGALLIGDPNSYLITRDCLGWKSICAFIALIFASAENFSKEIKMIMAGTLALIIANIFRILTTVILSEAGIISFEIIHSFFWKWGMTLIVLILWYLWLEQPINPGLQGIFK